MPLYQFKVTKPVSPQLKEAVVDNVKKQATKYKFTTNTFTNVGKVIVAMASTADRGATINTIKSLVNEDKLKISSKRRSKAEIELIVLKKRPNMDADWLYCAQAI